MIALRKIFRVTNSQIGCKSTVIGGSPCIQDVAAEAKLKYLDIWHSKDLAFRWIILPKGTRSMILFYLNI